MLTIQEQHERMIYPVVRVKTTRSGGSGTIIGCIPNGKGDFDTFVLTNWHVVEDAITYNTQWSSLLSRDVKVEVLDFVNVEIFEYINLSKVDTSKSYRASIVAYDKNRDLALLKLDTPKQVPYTAKLISRDRIKDLQMMADVTGSGCSLLHDPFVTRGEITSLKETFENKPFLMTSQNSIFGNSGGAIFLTDTAEQIGVTARITGIQLGFGMDVMTWMGFCVAPQSIYDFLEEQECEFIYDPTDTFEASRKRREAKRKSQERLQKVKDDASVSEEQDDDEIT